MKKLKLKDYTNREMPIGAVGTIGGVVVECQRAEGGSECSACAFNTDKDNCLNSRCDAIIRADSTSVHFVKISER